MSHFPKIQLLILSSLCVFLFFSRLLSGFQFGSPHFLLGASIFKGRLDYFPHNILQSSFLSFFLLFSLGFAFFHCYSLRSYQSPKNTLSMSQVKWFFLNFHRLFILLCWILIHLNPHPIPKKRCFFLRNKPLFVHFSFSIYSIFDLCPRAISFSVFSIFFAGKQPRILCFCVLSIILPPILTLELSVR